MLDFMLHVSVITNHMVLGRPSYGVITLARVREHEMWYWRDGLIKSAAYYKKWMFYILFPSARSQSRVNDTVRAQTNKQPISGFFFFFFLRGQVSQEKWRLLTHVWVVQERGPLIIIHPGTMTEIQHKRNNHHHKHAVMLLLLSEGRCVLAQVPLTVCGSLFCHWAEIKSFGDTSEADRRQGDCLLPTTGRMREKCQECWESIGFLWRKETGAFRPRHAFTYRHRGITTSLLHRKTTILGSFITTTA